MKSRKLKVKIMWMDTHIFLVRILFVKRGFHSFIFPIFHHQISFAVSSLTYSFGASNHLPKAQKRKDTHTHTHIYK